MKKYRVWLYYHTSISVDVEANDEEEAIESAREIGARDDADIIELILIGMEEDNSPDVEVISE